MNFELIHLPFESGFVGDVPVARLQESCEDVPRVQGVYLIVRTSDCPVHFLTTSSGGHFKGRDPTVTVRTLEDRWLDRPKVLYIGKAGGNGQRATLRERLHTYMQFGRGKPKAHWGGRYIWQLEDAGALRVFWKPTPADVPRHVEQGLLTAFNQQYGQLPFANLRT